MSLRYQGGILSSFYNGLKVPDPPTIGTATVASGTSVSVAFTGPACIGGSVISTYTAYCTTGTNTTTGASSPLVVTGLTTGQSYAFRVVATNIYGPSYPSGASNSVTPVVTCTTYTTAGTYSWVAPSGVTSVAAVAVGGGGGAGRNHGSGGGGGALRYVNGQSVTPGSSYTVQVGSAGSSPNACGCTNPGTSGGASSVFSISAGGGSGGAYGGGSSGSGGTGSGGTAGFSGGNGGTGVLAGGRGPGGGGGVGGYTGNGGQGGNDTGSYPVSGTAGSGSSPGTGGAGGNLDGSFTSGYNGQGWASLNGATAGYLGGTTTGVGIGSGAGGGGAGGQAGRTPGAGGVRIVWCSGGSRGTPSFPSTNVGP